MSYLMIQNQGIAPIDSFIMLGVSTARDNADAIGQFGSGNKLAIVTLLRAGLDPIIYCGKDKIEFFCIDKMMGHKPYQQVCYRVNNAKHVGTNISLEWGELDWGTRTDMALREFISNAIDASGVANCKFEIADKPRAKSGCTRIFIKDDARIMNYMQELESHFLHFTDNHNSHLLSKSSPSNAKIYRKGVFVRQVYDSTPSLFDYNFGDDFTIDESRNSDDYNCAALAAKYVALDALALVNIMQTFGDKEIWEHNFSQYDLRQYAEKSTWQAAWECAWGDSIPVENNAFQLQTTVRKGFRPRVVPQAWYNTLKRLGIRCYDNLVTHVESKGNEIVNTSSEAIAMLDKAWQWLCELNMTNNQPKPPLKCFSKHTSAGALLQGYYCPNDKTVYINIDCVTNIEVYLEELCHYITGSADLTRDFQNFFISGFSRACSILCE